MKGLARLAAIGVMIGTGAVAAADPPASDVDALVRREMARQRIPGLSLGVVREGRLVRAEGYGLASVELDAPVTPPTMFHSGSVGKQFTSALVLLLAAEGRLGLDDPCSTLPPEPPPPRPRSTLPPPSPHPSA